VRRSTSRGAPCSVTCQARTATKVGCPAVGDDLGVLEAMATTRAIRRLRSDPIPEEDLRTILWHATRAPSGSNRQPTRFLVLRDGPAATEAKALLGNAFRHGW